MKRKCLFILIGLLLQTVLISGQSPLENSSAEFYKNEISPRSLQERIFGNAPVYVSQNGGMSYHQLKNCGASSLMFAPETVACNGASVTPISFSNAIRSVVSGTTNKVGVVYRYASAGIAPDGKSIDAYVKVVSYSNNQNTDQTTFAGADTPQTTAF